MLFREQTFLRSKSISALRLRWYGDHYKDMPISIDLVPCVEFDDYNPHRKYTNTPCKYYVFCKPKPINTSTLLYPVVYTSQEQTFMAEMSQNARDGLKLAKALRISRLLSNSCARVLSESARNLHSCLKTYMLKTCLFVLHQRLTDPTVALLPEQWALLIYEQLIEFACIGQLPMPFDSFDSEDNTALIGCLHPCVDIIVNKEQRSPCCDQRFDVFCIVTQLKDILENYCKTKGIDVTAPALKPYDHSAVDCHV